jgi:hypothetical protein
MRGTDKRKSSHPGQGSIDLSLIRLVTQACQSDIILAVLLIVGILP